MASLDLARVPTREDELHPGPEKMPCWGARVPNGVHAPGSPQLQNKISAHEPLGQMAGRSSKWQMLG